MRKINCGELKVEKVLFLGYGEKDSRIIQRMVDLQFDVWHTNDCVSDLSDFDLVISYGYRFILDEKTLSSASRPVINLHISYLPWNRGAHPNFWSFFDGTPSGVSIHILDLGLDTGDVLFQKYVDFSVEEDTFVKTYWRLRFEVESLFLENIHLIVSGGYSRTPQCGKGSYHRQSDLPLDFQGWDTKIEAEIARLKK